MHGRRATRPATRRGELDAARSGLVAISVHGAYWIAGDLRVDLVALNKIEMLPFDVWGAGWEPGGQPTIAHLQLVDSVAALYVDADGPSLSCAAVTRPMTG